MILIINNYEQIKNQKLMDGSKSLDVCVTETINQNVQNIESVFNSTDAKVIIHVLFRRELLGALGTSKRPFFLVYKSDMSSQVSSLWKCLTTESTLVYCVVGRYSRICDWFVTDVIMEGFL